jgi:sigma-70-like protein
MTDDIRAAILQLIEKLGRSSVVTYSDLNEVFPPRELTSREVEEVFELLAEHGIEPIEG